MNRIELLAPAGNLTNLKIAVANGADAVYLGIDEFNARANEENFTIESLKEGIDYAHLFGVKVYLALNILLKDSEIDLALELTEKALQMGVDALILQDIGLAMLIKKRFPNAVLHASTQMGCSNLEGAKFLKNLGFSRIVLARETPLEDIKIIKQELDIEIEYFVHGALCVSYSGNCYLCSLLADASGNRGKCKQFCRLSCSINGNGIFKRGYMLSTKDICMLSKLKELENAGVDSFKIEGRARRGGYVGRVTKIYREAIDGNGYSQQDLLSLKKVFNRGDFCEGYLSGEKMIYDKAQNHIGLEIGYVEKLNKGKKFNEIFINSTHEISKGDILKFFENDTERGVIGVEDCKNMGRLYRVTSTFLPQKGDKVRIILDASEDEEVVSATKTIEFDGVFIGHINEKAKLILCHDESEVIVESDEILQEAKSSPLKEEEVLSCLQKFSSQFKINNLKCDLENVFLVKSALNSLRRKGEEKLKEKILKDYLIKNNLIFQKNDEKIDIFSKKQQIKRYFMTDKNIFPDGYDGYIFVPKYYDEKTFLSLDFTGREIFLSTPVFATEKEVEKLKELLKKFPNLGIYANNYYALNLTDKNRTIIGDNLNIFNSFSVKFYAENGYKNIVLSKENLDLSKINNCGINLIYLEKFYPELMNFAHCPIKEHLNGKCSKCLFKDGYSYKISGRQLNLVRRKLISCHFVLKDTKPKQNSFEGMSKIIEGE